jgi:hypothetical protein
MEKTIYPMAIHQKQSDLMYRTVVANLPLHGGKAPSWLTVRMRKLAKEIANIMIEEYGTATFIERLSDPYWFKRSAAS